MVSTPTVSRVCSVYQTIIIASTPYYVNWTSYIGPQTLNAGNIVNVSPLKITDQYLNPNKFVYLKILVYSDDSCSTLTSYPLVILTGNSSTSDANGFVYFNSLNITTVGRFYLKAIFNSYLPQSSCSSLVWVIPTVSRTLDWNPLLFIGNFSAGVSYPSITFNFQDLYRNPIIGENITIQFYNNSYCNESVSNYPVISGNFLTTNLSGLAVFNNFKSNTAGKYV